jgi:hypothetical protein
MSLTDRTIASIFGNQLFSDSILNKDVEKRQKLATQKAVEWRKNNPQQSSEIGVMGGISSLEQNKGIHAESFEVKSERAKKNYKKGKGFAKLTPQELSDNGTKYGKQNLIGEIVCEKCVRTVNKGNYSQFHGNNCNELQKIQLLELLPHKFTKSILIYIAKINNIENVETLNILHDTCPYTFIKSKIQKSNQFNPQWYFKNQQSIESYKEFYYQTTGKKIENVILLKKYEDIFNISPNHLQNQIIENIKSNLKSSRKKSCNKEHLAKMSKENGEKRSKHRLEKHHAILTLITKKEFQIRDVRNACMLFGIDEKHIIATAKRVLKEKTLVVMVQKGNNHINPSIYKKIF